MTHQAEETEFHMTIGITVRGAGEHEAVQPYVADAVQELAHSRLFLAGRTGEGLISTHDNDHGRVVTTTTVTRGRRPARGEPEQAAAAPSTTEEHTMNDPITLPVRDPGPDALEREIQARASVAPRVTPADVAAAIAAEFYFTAADGVLGQSEMGTRPATWTNLDQVTICVLVLRNGAKVLGVNYGAIDRARHDATMGREEARKMAVEKVWELLGFRLRDKLHAQVRCQGERCMATTQNGLHHSRECLEEAGRNQGWTPTAEELAAAGPSAPFTTEA